MLINRKHFSLIDSTNTWAKQNAHLLPKDVITLVTADEQTAGRGRFKRHWVSPPKQNIYASFCFFLKMGRPDIGNIPQVLALSTVTVLRKWGFSAFLKWPNDVLISKKKVAGILAETTTVDDQLCMVLGIGLNVNMPLELLEGIDRPATSLSFEGKRHFDIEEVLQVLQKQFVADLSLFLDQGFSHFLETYRRYHGEYGITPIRFHDNQKIWEGLFHAINDDGSLVLQLSDGTLKTFIAGEILF